MQASGMMLVLAFAELREFHGGCCEDYLLIGLVCPYFFKDAKLSIYNWARSFRRTGRFAYANAYVESCVKSFAPTSPIKFAPF